MLETNQPDWFFDQIADDCDPLDILMEEEENDEYAYTKPSQKRHEPTTTQVRKWSTAVRFRPHTDKYFSVGLSTIAYQNSTR